MTQQEYANLQELFNKEGQPVSWNIANVLSGRNYINKNALISAAYVLYKAENGAVNLDNLDSFCTSVNADANRKSFLESFIGDVWPMVAGLRYRYSSSVLRSIVLFYEDRDMRFGDDKTPPSISKLACKLFGFGIEDEVADYGIGSAAFAIEAFLNNPTIKLYGIDIKADAVELAAMKLDVLGCNAALGHVNILDADPDSHKFSNIFSNYPFGLRLKEIGFEKNQMLRRISQKHTAITKSVSSDWIFNAAIVECLKPNGKAIAIMTNGSTWNTLDRTARQHFIENGYIEAIIALPERMFESINIPTTMIVMSEGNERIMLVDATDHCDRGRRFNTFTDEQIEDIAYAVYHETAHSRFVSREELAANEYVINPTRYLTENIEVENGVPFSSIIKSITRGAPLTASDLDAAVSTVPTDYQYLMLANIQHGQIDTNLPYLKSIQDNQIKYCLKNHALILSKNGAPFKIAVAEVQPGRTILANGNLYIIEIDESKADPYFIKAFLESEKGAALLKSITVGATIPNIGVEALKKLLIPGVPLEEQHEIAIRYLAKVDEINLYRRKLQRAYEELNHIYDNRG